MIQLKLIKPIFQATCIMILLTGCLKANEPEPKIDRSLTCVPDKPVDLGKIYSESMQKMFQNQLNHIWTADEHANRNEPDWGLHDNIYDKSCKIIRPFWGEPTLGSKSCLPWKIKTYDTIDKVVQWRETGKISHTFEELVGKHWQGEAFDPRVENPFKPEWHNRDADFAVMMRLGHWTRFYPKNCCKILTYHQMMDEITNRRHEKEKIIINNGQNMIYSNTETLISDINPVYKELYFRKIHSWSIDEDVGIKDNEQDINLLRYPLNVDIPVTQLPIVWDKVDYHHKNYIKKSEILRYIAINKCGNETGFYFFLDY